MMPTLASSIRATYVRAVPAMSETNQTEAVRKFRPCGYRCAVGILLLQERSDDQVRKLRIHTGENQHVDLPADALAAVINSNMIEARRM